MFRTRWISVGTLLLLIFTGIGVVLTVITLLPKQSMRPARAKRQLTKWSKIGIGIGTFLACVGLTLIMLVCTGQIQPRPDSTSNLAGLYFVGSLFIFIGGFTAFASVTETLR